MALLLVALLPLALPLPVWAQPGESPPGAGACEDPAALVSQVEQAVLEARFEEARATTDRAETAFGCTGSAEGTLLARLWLAEGAMAHVEGDAGSRDQAFASALRIAPGQWTEAFGDELKALWQAAAGLPRATGTLQVEGLAEGQAAFVDGQPVTVPAELESGLYLVQADGGPPLFTRIVLLPGDQTLVVRVEPAAGSDAGEAATLAGNAPESKRHRGRWLWFAGAGAGAALAGTSALLATRQDGGMEQAASVDELDGAWARQRGYGYATYALAGLSAACVGVGIAW